MRPQRAYTLLIQRHSNSAATNSKISQICDVLNYGFSLLDAHFDVDVLHQNHWPRNAGFFFVDQLRPSISNQKTNHTFTQYKRQVIGEALLLLQKGISSPSMLIDFHSYHRFFI